MSVTSTSLSSGNANCPSGGSSFTSSTGLTYACNGAAGASAPASEEGTGPSVGWFSDGEPHEVAMVVTSTRSLVTGLASISFLPATEAGVTQPVTVVCAIQAGLSQIGSAMVGAPTGAYGGIASLTAQGRSETGTYHLTCRRLSASGSYYVSSPKLTAIAVS